MEIEMEANCSRER